MCYLVIFYVYFCCMFFIEIIRFIFWEVGFKFVLILKFLSLILFLVLKFVCLLFYGLLFWLINFVFSVMGLVTLFSVRLLVIFSLLLFFFMLVEVNVVCGYFVVLRKFVLWRCLLCLVWLVLTLVVLIVIFILLVVGFFLLKVKVLLKFLKVLYN